jgi:Flp pilus assembly pilin Flp
MSRLPSNRSGENFIEFALIIILLAIVMLSILLIVGDSIRVFLNDIGIRWSLFNNQGAMLPTLQQLQQWFT